MGDLELPHRLVMAPMTRSRATPEGVPSALNAEYYRQRASTALIISEGTQPSADGQGYTLTPGIHTEAQIAGWRLVTDAVHEAGGRIVIQLMHVGRISHPSDTPHSRQPVAPSAVQPKGQMFTQAGMRSMPVPRALSAPEIRQTVDDFRRAAAAAIAAGADGVELHGANGYLIHQFLADNANLRDDAYGGSVENRVRFAVEVAAAVASEIGPGRVGFRVSPGKPYNDIVETQTSSVYAALTEALAPLKLAYLHVVHSNDEALLSTFRRLWPGALLVNRDGAALPARFEDLDRGLADAVAVGALTLANPDLVDRLKKGAPLNAPDSSTFFGGGARGYTDYPALVG
jgi:N-ethylmaleimide reductase